MLNLQFDIVLMTRISTNLPLTVRQFQYLDIATVPRSNTIWRPQAPQYHSVAQFDITGINPEAILSVGDRYGHLLCPGLQPGPPSQTPGGLGQR